MVCGMQGHSFNLAAPSLCTGEQNPALLCHAQQGCLVDTVPGPRSSRIRKLGENAVPRARFLGETYAIWDRSLDEVRVDLGRNVGHTVA